MDSVEHALSLAAEATKTSKAGSNRGDRKTKEPSGSTALLVLSIAYGAPLVTVVALQPIATDFGTQRAGPAPAVSLTYIGSGLGVTAARRAVFEPCAANAIAAPIVVARICICGVSCELAW